MKGILLKKTPHFKKNLTNRLFFSEKYYFCSVFNNKKKLLK